MVFAFPGQGNQYLEMGLGLYQNQPVYRDTIDECAEILRPHLDIDLRDLMFAPAHDKQAAAILNQTRYTQPAIFISSYAMAQCWLSWGIKPDIMIGHSVGEYVAATLAGVFSLQHAVLAIAQRSQLIQNLPEGSMLAVLLPEQEVIPLLPSVLSVAAINNPGLTVVAGPTPAISELEDYLASKKIFSKRLDTSHAFHSAMMDPALSDFAKTMDRIELYPPQIPIVSTVTGKWLTANDATNPDYWVQHMRHPVRFSDAFQTLIKETDACVFLECGPSHSLASAAKQHGIPKEQLFVVSSMRSATDTDTDSVYLMNAVGGLWAADYPVLWSLFYGESLPGHISAPGYPFERVSLPLISPKMCKPERQKTIAKNLM
jgi:acyl transferase domain-containing protein